VEGWAEVTEQEEFEFRDRLEREQAAAKTPQAEPPRKLSADRGEALIGGINRGFAGLAGLPVDTMQGAANLVAAGAHAAASPFMDTGVFKPPFQGGPLSSQGIAQGMNRIGLMTENPNPQDMASRMLHTGGMIASSGVRPQVMPAVAGAIGSEVLGDKGAALGALVPALASKGARAVAPNLSDNAKLLLKEGVMLTPGQMAGGTVKRMEDAATSIPVLGDAIKAAQRRGIESFNTATINRSLAPIGETLPKGLKGHSAIEYAYGKLGDAYDNLLPKMKGSLDTGLKQDIDAIRQLGMEVPEPQRGQLQRIIDREVLKRFPPGGNGETSGEAIKGMESELGRLGKTFKNSDNYDTRTLGGAVEEMQNALRRMVERNNPKYAEELAKINEGYANFKKAQNAASSATAQEGTFTPAQLHRAVRAGDTSKDKARFAEGNALMQDLSRAGKDVLPSAVPDSGTPLRSMIAYAATHPVKATVFGIPLGAASLAYTRPGQAALQSLLSGGGTRQPMGLQEIIQQAVLANARPQEPSQPGYFPPQRGAPFGRIGGGSR
jgi:hypothetical protein